MVLFSPPLYPVDLKKHKSGPNGWKIQSSSRFGLGDYVCIVMIAYSNGKRKENTIILQKIHNLIELQYTEGLEIQSVGRQELEFDAVPLSRMDNVCQDRGRPSVSSA